jgi:hypothetical protein
MLHVAATPDVIGRLHICNVQGFLLAQKDVPTAANKACTTYNAPGSVLMLSLLPVCQLPTAGKGHHSAMTYE